MKLKKSILIDFIAFIDKAATFKTLNDKEAANYLLGSSKLSSILLDECYFSDFANLQIYNIHFKVWQNFILAIAVLNALSPMQYHDNLDHVIRLFHQEPHYIIIKVIHSLANQLFVQQLI